MDSAVAQSVANEVQAVSLGHILSISTVSAASAERAANMVTLLLQSFTLRLFGILASYGHRLGPADVGTDDSLYGLFLPLGQRWRETSLSKESGGDSDIAKSTDADGPHFVFAAGAHMFFKDACSWRFENCIGGRRGAASLSSSQTPEGTEPWTAATAKLFQGWVAMACADVQRFKDVINQQASTAQRQCAGGFLAEACAAAALDFLAAWLRTESRGERGSMHHAGGTHSSNTTTTTCVDEWIPTSVATLLLNLTSLSEAVFAGIPLFGNGALDVRLAVAAAVLHLAQVSVTRAFDVALFGSLATQVVAERILAAAWVWVKSAAQSTDCSFGAVFHVIADKRSGRIFLQRFLQLAVVVDSGGRNGQSGAACEQGRLQLPSGDVCCTAALALLVSASPGDIESHQWTGLCFRFLFSTDVVTRVLSTATHPMPGQAPVKVASSTESGFPPVQKTLAAGEEVSSDTVLAVRGVLLQGAYAERGGCARASPSSSVLDLPPPWMSQVRAAVAAWLRARALVDCLVVEFQLT